MKKYLMTTLSLALCLCLMCSLALAQSAPPSFQSVAEHWIKEGARGKQGTDKLEQGDSLSMKALLYLSMCQVMDAGEATDLKQLREMEPMINVFEGDVEGKKMLLFSFNAMSITGEVSLLFNARTGDVLKLQVEAGGNG